MIHKNLQVVIDTCPFVLLELKLYCTSYASLHLIATDKPKCKCCVTVYPDKQFSYFSSVISRPVVKWCLEIGHGCFFPNPLNVTYFYIGHYKMSTV